MRRKPIPSHVNKVSDDGLSCVPIEQAEYCKTYQKIQQPNQCFPF